MLSSSSGARMDSIELALANWTALYEQFQQARARLKRALERRGPVPTDSGKRLTTANENALLRFLNSMLHTPEPEARRLHNREAQNG